MIIKQMEKVEAKLIKEIESGNQTDSIVGLLKEAVVAIDIGANALKQAKYEISTKKVEDIMKIKDYQEKIDEFCGERVIACDVKVAGCDGDTIRVEIKTEFCTFLGEISADRFEEDLNEAIISAYESALYAAQARIEISEMNIDDKAKDVFEFANYLGNRFESSQVKCSVCQNPYESYYCEDGIYIVRCRQCAAFALVAAPNAEIACKRANK